MDGFSLFFLYFYFHGAFLTLCEEEQVYIIKKEVFYGIHELAWSDKNAKEIQRTRTHVHFKLRLAI